MSERVHFFCVGVVLPGKGPPAWGFPAEAYDGITSYTSTSPPYVLHRLRALVSGLTFDVFVVKVILPVLGLLFVINST